MVSTSKRHLPNVYEKFVNMLSCKLRIGKIRAEKLFLEALEVLREKLNIDPIEALESAIRSLEPPLKTKKKKMGGKVYPLPSYLNANGRLYFSMNFIMQAIKQNTTTRNLSERISSEIIKVFENTSHAHKLKEELLGTIDENRPFQRLKRKKRKISTDLRVPYLGAKGKKIRQGKLDRMAKDNIESNLPKGVRTRQMSNKKLRALFPDTTFPKKISKSKSRKQESGLSISKILQQTALKFDSKMSNATFNRMRKLALDVKPSMHYKGNKPWNQEEQDRKRTEEINALPEAQKKLVINMKELVRKHSKREVAGKEDTLVTKSEPKDEKSSIEKLLNAIRGVKPAEEPKVRADTKPKSKINLKNGKTTTKKPQDKEADVRPSKRGRKIKG